VVKREQVNQGTRLAASWAEDRVFVITTAALVALVVFAWASYGLIGKWLIKSMYTGMFPSVAGDLLQGRSGTPLANYYREAERLLWVLTAVPILFVALAALAKVGVLDKLLVSGASFLLVFWLAFCAIEFYPPLIGVLGLDRKLEYYAHKLVLRPHEKLIYVFQDDTQRLGSARFKGDQYSPAYGVQTATIEFGYWERNNGFVIGPPAPSTDVVIMGDSYVEAGSSYDDILGSRLAAASRLRTVTLGVGGYGPFQYLEIFKTYGVKLKPRYAIMAFFEGNDALNVKDYLGWRKGDGGYYDRVDQAWFPPLWRRYFYVLGQLGQYLERLGTTSLDVARLRLGLGTGGVHPDLVVLNLGAEKQKAVFYYKNDARSSEEMLQSAEWKALGDILAEFKAVAEANGIAPLVLYIPAAAHVYADLTTKESGANWLKIRNEQILASENEEQAMREIARRADIRLVSLTPVFKAAAKKGRMLYYPFDSHWNSEGRQTAAAYLASVLRPSGKKPAAEGAAAQEAAKRPAKNIETMTARDSTAGRSRTQSWPILKTLW
jgi:hypothetical protein